MGDVRMSKERERFPAEGPTSIHVRRATPKPTVVYDTYWRFAAERQAIFHRRASGASAPWTNDTILREHKFTNAYRASDRVSQYLIQNVIYELSDDGTPRRLTNRTDEERIDTFFRILLFKLFNRIETWELLRAAVGPIRYDTYQYEQFEQVLARAMSRGMTIYSAAYIMPSGKSVFGFDRKHRTHLKLLEKMIADGLPAKLATSTSMHDGFALFRQYPTIGDFLAYQYVTDVNYSDLTDYSESDFVIPGPGARDGIRKCFSDLGGYSESDVIRMMADQQDEEFDRLGIHFQSLWGRPLQYIDCQNLFCEVDKYSRVKHPEVQGHTGRTRIKQKFRPQRDRLRLWYPPKWNINERVLGDLGPISLLPPTEEAQRTLF